MNHIETAPRTEMLENKVYSRHAVMFRHGDTRKDGLRGLSSEGINQVDKFLDGYCQRLSETTLVHPRLILIIDNGMLRVNESAGLAHAKIEQEIRRAKLKNTGVARIHVPAFQPAKTLTPLREQGIDDAILYNTWITAPKLYLEMMNSRHYSEVAPATLDLVNYYASEYASMLVPQHKKAEIELLIPNNEANIGSIVRWADLSNDWQIHNAESLEVLFDMQGISGFSFRGRIVPRQIKPHIESQIV